MNPRIAGPDLRFIKTIEMCARYFIEEDLYDAIAEYPQEDGAGLRRTGDIRPSEEAPVLAVKDECIRMESVRWGYPGIGGKGLLINARAESVEEKYSFSEGIRKGRILIPASGFYEWDPSKNRVAFRHPKERALYLAGITGLFSGEKRFTILTREANSSMEGIHDRMPLLIPKERIGDWLFSEGYRELLGSSMPELSAFREYEQLSLF
ncbi:MAG: SOS response-associated peptidase [Lachnospiraceae bacterium]|nr:SOS response-associated peptidase [Lachnospiraceae bacterium]